jgi:hypothetical protein
MEENGVAEMGRKTKATIKCDHLNNEKNSGNPLWVG